MTYPFIDFIDGTERIRCEVIDAIPKLFGCVVLARPLRGADKGRTILIQQHRDDGSDLVANTGVSSELVEVPENWAEYSYEVLDF